MMRPLLIYTARLLPVLAVLAGAAAAADDPPSPPLPGRAFQSRETQTREADEGANPGFLWVEQGQQLWTKIEGTAGRACATCHGEDGAAMRGVATHYPMVTTSGRLVNLEQRINRCRTGQMGAPALGYETNGLLSLTAFITHQSNGMKRSVKIDGPAAPYFEQGRSFFFSRQGQLNLACSQCHNDNVGKHLRGDIISQGQSDGWPAYRLEWQTMGSLHRRLRACSLGVRAEILDYGAPEYVALELYLAWRGRDLPIASPGVRR
jgi:sulfur-oxidizing protein SoxA